MRVSFENVLAFLEFNIDQKYAESNELLESILLSSVDCSDYRGSGEFSIDYFLIFNQNYDVFFNRVKSALHKLINFPLRVSKFTDSYGNLIYSLLVFTNKLVNILGIEIESVDLSFQVCRFLLHVQSVAQLLGNWKHLSPNTLDAKCLQSERSGVENVYTTNLHCLLSVQSIILYLTSFLSQKLASQPGSGIRLAGVRQQSPPLCSMANSETSMDEQSFLDQQAVLFINNLSHLHLYLFNKRILNMMSIDLSKSVTAPCECVTKSWYLTHRILQSNEVNKSQQSFWTAFSRVVNKFRDCKQPVSISSTHSGTICIESEAKQTELINHFVLLLNYDVSNSLRFMYDTSSQIQSATYLDPSYQILKNVLKDILDQSSSQGVAQAQLTRLYLPLQLVCHLYSTTVSSNSSMFSDLSNMTQSSFSFTSTSSTLGQKTLIDVLILFWESFFCKHLNSTFVISPVNSILSSIGSHEFDSILRSVQKICNTSTYYWDTGTEFSTAQINLYHLFLRFLYLNIRESGGNSTNLNSSIIQTNQATSAATNLGWRQFKGRLYTRLHDKRVAELDLNGMINVAHLFFTLIKCFASNASSLMLKSDQVENYFRILNIFVKSKSLGKLEQILPQGSSGSRSSAVVAIFNTKFAAMKLWLEQESENTLSQEAEDLVKSEFVAVVNQWLEESTSLIASESSNQITGFKYSQVINQFLCDFLVSYIGNCRVLMQGDEKINLYQLALVSCSLLDKIDYEQVFKILSRKQLELVLSKFTELFTRYNKLVQNELSSHAFNSKLSTSLSEFLLKIWSVLMNNQSTLNMSSAFSYEIVSTLHFEICHLHSNLFYTSSNVASSSKETKSLSDMIDSFSLSSFPVNTNAADESPGSIIIRLKFLTLLLETRSMFELCTRHMVNFEAKLVNFLIYAHVNINNSKMSGELASASFVDLELSKLAQLCASKLVIFRELEVVYCSSGLESMLNQFVENYSRRLKSIQSFNERKIQLDNLNLYLQDFQKMVVSLNTMSTHTVIYKSYLLAAQIVLHLSVFLHSRGKSDTLFAKIIDKMVLPIGIAKQVANKVASLAAVNNQNSILVSLKDTLHTFLLGISKLNYEYDGYLQRVLQSIISNYLLKFSVKLEDHFLVLAIESSFSTDPASESILYRACLLKMLKQSFLASDGMTKNVTDTEKVLQLVHHFCVKTTESRVILKDIEIFLHPLLIILSSESNTLRTRSLPIFNMYINYIKQNSDQDECLMMIRKCVEELVRTQQEPNKLLISLTLLAKQKINNAFDFNTKETILSKVEDCQSKFRYNTELKNSLYTLFEYLDGEEGKAYLNKRLDFLCLNM